MKKQFAGSLQEGDVLNDYFVAARKDLRDTQSGSKFLGMVLKDRTGEVGAILWTNAASVARQFEVGDVVNVRGTVTTYQDKLQVRIEQVLPMRSGEFETVDLVYIPDNIADIRKHFFDLIGTVKNEWLKKLVECFFKDKELVDRFAAAAAGKKWHHSYRGGLLQHCYEIAQIVEGVCKVFPKLDRDMLMAAVLFHDLGKVYEMSHDLNVDYTDAGKLVGHLVIGTHIVQKMIDTIDGFPEPIRLQLFHCILSHHGELVNGSPIVPKTLEALVLFHCDNLDAQVDAWSRVVEETRDKDQQWSDYITTIARQIWTKGA